MNRKLMLVPFVLCPMLSGAQAITSAQLQFIKSPVLAAKLVSLATPAASVAKVRAAAAMPPIRISTGVTGPKLLQSVTVVRTHNWMWNNDETSRAAVVSLTVDGKGVPTNVKIVQSAGPFMDQDIVESVARFRFTPGMLDGQPTTVDMTLKLIIQRESN